MAVSSSSAVSQQTSASSSSRRPGALLTVIRWELRRLGSARATWLIPLAVFALGLLIELAESTNYDLQTVPSAFGPRTLGVDFLSNYGLFHTMPMFLGMVMALFIPFLCTDAVAIDLKRRTHELLMTTSLPSWAYLLGRYICSLLISMILACVLLLSIICASLMAHLYVPANISVPTDIRGILILWVAIFPSTVLILSSISFALGTLWPRLSTAFKVTLLLVWFLDAPIISRLNGGKLAAWDPTTQLLAQAQTVGSVMTQLVQQTQHLSNQVFFARLVALEQQLPDMSSWVGPRLVWIGCGLLCLVFTLLLFRRFSNTLN